MHWILFTSGDHLRLGSHIITAAPSNCMPCGQDRVTFSPTWYEVFCGCPFICAPRTGKTQEVSMEGSIGDRQRKGESEACGESSPTSPNLP